MIFGNVLSFYETMNYFLACWTLFFWAPKSLQMVTAATKLKDAYSMEESYDQPR